ncbi:hypothetical protein KEM55_008465 [Ascosphaera atra]|nr:hypothetical protein KEM55_008465 [Ascosphaera atra]
MTPRRSRLAPSVLPLSPELPENSPPSVACTAPTTAAFSTPAESMLRGQAMGHVLPNAKADPEGLRADCERLLEYFDIQEVIPKENQQSGDRLISIIRRRRLLRQSLTENAFADYPCSEEESEAAVPASRKKQKQQRQKSRQTREREASKTPLRHKTTIDLLGDDSSE